MGKRNIEKSLKRFLKRKISYTFALWVVFMITGGIAFGAPVTMGDAQKINREIQETKSDLLTKIQIEKDKIKKKIFENEKLIKKYNSNAEELVKKGNFYSKSLVNSTQVFFYYQHLSNEELKDKTDKEFAETIDAINKYLGNESGKTLLKSTGNIAIDKITSGNGVAVDLEGFRETIEIGANIKPVEPELPAINSNISVSPTAPNIVLGTLPETVTPNISFPTDILVPNIILQTPPDSINITVALPEAVDKLAINLGDIEGPKFPDEKDIAILEVATPNPINPTTISIPEIPSSPEILLPRTPSFNLTSISLGNGDRVFIDAVSDASGTEENAIISNVAVIGGDFKIKREEVGNGDSNNNNSFTYSYTGYKVLPYLSLAFSSGVDVDKDGNPINDLDTVYEIKDTNGKKSFWSSYTGGTGVQKLVNNYGMLTNGNFTVTRESKNENTNLGEFVHIDLHSNTWKIANMQNILDSITNKIPEDKNKIMTAWNSASNQAAYEHGMYWLNNGKIILEGGNLSITNQYTHTPHGIPEAEQNSQSLLVINTGSLEIRPYKSQDGSIYDSYNSVFLISNDTNRDAQHIWYNSGEIKTYTTDTAIFTINSDNNSNTANKIDIVIDNKGKIEMTGNKSVGVYAKAAKSYDHVDSDGKNYTFGSLKMNFADDDNGTNRKPIVLYGDNSIGLYVLEKFRPSNEKISGNFHVDIGDTSGQANKLINIDSRETNGGLSINDYEGENIDLETIDGSIGILSHNGMNLSSHGVNIYENTKDSIGVVPLRGTSVSTVPTLELGKGSIELLGGENNIGILAMNFYNGAALTHKGGNVLTKGSVVLSKGNKNVGIIAKEGYKVSVKELKTIGEAADNAIGIYGDGNGTSIVVEEGVKNLKLKVDSPANTNTVNAVAAYSSNGAKITMNKLSLNDSLDIEVTGAKVSGEEKSYRGIGLMASDGTIEAQKTNIKVSNGAAGIVSLGINGFIDLKGGQLEVDNGYAVYSDGNGKVDIRNAKIILNGNTIAFDLDPNVLSPIIFDETTNIHIKSNDVVVFNVKNLTFSNISELKSTILSGANINITSEIGVTKYLEAVLEGTTLNFDIALNKSSVDSTNAGFYYFNRILAQNSILNVNNTINAQLASTSTENALGADNYKGQVIGLEMNATKKAISNASTQINISSTGAIKAERTDSAGSGAIGAFINYGILTNEIGGKIEVQKTYSCAGGIGIYSVNGSKVVNSGTVEVGGNNAIGILGMTYREDSTGTPVINEFGTLAIGQGKVNISNSGSVTLKGTGTIGIYAWNNNSTGTKADNIVTNTTTGKITVGNSTVTNTSVGIYGDKATISNLGKVSVGDGGVAIYAKNGTEVTDLGTLDLGANGVGVMADGTSDISATAVTFTSNNTGTLGKTGIFYKGTGSENKSINIAIDASALTKGTAVYAENMNITSSGTLGIGQEGVGIFVKGTSANTGTNSGTINLTSGKTGAVGMYTKTANILNNTGGIINVNDSSQIGIYTEGTGNRAINKGTINLNVDGATGIYVKSGAITELDTGNTITFSGKSSVGVFAESAQVNFKNNLTLTNNNENKNIFVYGKGATVGIDSGKIVTVDGVGTPTTPGNKTVGIYLENAGTGSTFNGAAGQLIVQREAVGIYSKGNNTLNVHVTATGEKTTGVFIDGASTITGTVTAQGTSTAGAVGVYGSGGAVTIGAGGLTLNTNLDKGTGMYLTDGASATGGGITVNNTAGVKNIGVYYSKGTTSGTVTNGSAISLVGSNSIGIYAADGINLVNSKDITSTGISDNIASYVGGNSTLTSNGNITMTGTGNIGIYTGKGSGINNGAIDLTGSTGTSSAGMVAKTDASSDTASVENKNTITVGSNLGMYVAGNGTSSGKNTGTITATTGTGVYVNGSGNSFNGTGGTITSNAVGIYLKDTGANKITAGTLNIASGGVGVFGENAKIDFAVNVTGTGAVGVAAKNGSVISGNVTTGQDSVGVYLLDDTVTFNGANIVTGTNNSGTSVGVLFDAVITGTYTMNNVSVNAKNGVGIYLGGAGMNLNHNGTVTTENGIGIYVPTGTTLATGTSVMNVNGGTGVYIHGGTANLGISGNLIFNFLTSGGIGVFNNGGTLNLGNNITVNGSGTLVVTANGSLNSTGNLNIGAGGIGLMGLYDAAVTAPQSITNNGGTITAVSGGIGLAAVKGTTNPGFTITIRNSGTINANSVSSTNTPSIGIFTDVADVINTGIINVGSNGIGIYSNHNGVLTSVQNDKMTMTGTDGIGIYLKGATAGLTSNNINSTGLRNTGVVLEGVTTNINVGTINLGNESIGVLATTGTTSTLNGAVTVGNSSAGKSAIGVVANGGSNITIAGSSIITAGNGGIGVYAEGAGTIVTVSNTGNITVGTDGIYMYSKDAALNFTGNITADNQIGIVADGGSVTSSGSSSITAKNGGIGVYVKNAAPIFETTTIAVQGGNTSKYSMGVYYDGVSSIGTAPTITQTGSYTIGIVLNNSTGIVNREINIGSTAISNQIGIIVKGNSDLTVMENISVRGSKNIGVYGEKSKIKVSGDVTVLNSPTCVNKSESSIGISISNSSYLGIGNISVGDYSIGILGKNMTSGNTITQGTGVEIMTIGKDGLGIYGEGTGGIITVKMSNILIGTDNAIGVYAKGMDSKVTGDMKVGANTSIGIVSEGNGDVFYTGSIRIENKLSTASVGIYKKDGSGTISTSEGNWNVGNSGYGIYLKQSTGLEAVINNKADMNLGMSSIGIFSNGKNIVNNIGNITVGATDVQGDHDDSSKHLNSIGIYATGGTKVNNTGNITVNYDHSIGIYGDGAETRIQNTGTINVDGGGVGILVRDGAVAVNAVGGIIILGSTSAPDPCTATTIGMAAYSGARIENAGTITVNEGVGMLIGRGATFDNSGTIYLKNGIGIEGLGAVNNYGNIIILPGGNGTPGANAGVSNAEVGSVKIESDGTITISDKYVSIGGTLSTAGNIVVDGAYVDVTTGTPLFNANSVSGEVRLLPNFATTGNGISYEIEGFINTAMGTVTGNKLTPVTSPLFIAKVTDKGSLVIVKRPYADLTIGDQFNALDKGLDNILKNSGGNGKDAEILKGLNKYLEGLSSDRFEREASQKLAEFRGDIYATIQGRMQDINRAFDNSFYELESSYNLTKDSSKYSVIYTDGNYKDSTLGIDDYDYKVMGVLYMKEKEGTEYGSKYGYTLGFTGSKFDFNDGGSKEDVYSLRAGAHRVKNLSEEYKVSWLSRIELGYNRHIAKRKLNLQETYENKGGYNTYSVALDNRLTKVIYTDLSRQLDVYADLDLEYGKIDDFKESAGSKGGLEVQIKDNDYLSAQAGAGVKASQRIYAGNDISVKVTADVKYAYEFGDNYDGNKARLKNGGEGYYSLITPEESEGKLTGKIGLTIEKANHMGVTFEVEAADEGHKKDSSIKYGMRFNYKF